MNDNTLKYREQHKERLNYMPWLYWRLKPQQRLWADEWQKDWQTYLQDMETVIIEGDCFIASTAKLFAEPGRQITIAAGSFIGADCVLHGPVAIGQNVGINHHATLDGGKAGITIGDHCRIAAYCSIYSFNHKIEKQRLINDQNVSSDGIKLGKDVWLGAHVAVTDGTTINDGTVVGTRSVVTKDTEAYGVYAGNPARRISDRV